MQVLVMTSQVSTVNYQRGLPQQGNCTGEREVPGLLGTVVLTNTKTGDLQYHCGLGIRKDACGNQMMNGI